MGPRTSTGLTFAARLRSTSTAARPRSTTAISRLAVAWSARSGRAPKCARAVSRTGKWCILICTARYARRSLNRGPLLLPLLRRSNPDVFRRRPARPPGTGKNDRMAAGLLDQFDDHVAVALATKQTLAGPVAALARQAAERIEAGGKGVFFGNG